jgi:hypothetical protein
VFSVLATFGLLTWGLLELCDWLLGGEA